MVSLAEQSVSALCGVFRDVWTVRVPTTVDRWAGDKRIIPSRGNPEPGRWSNERTPYLIEIMRSCSDPTVSEVSVKKGSQLGVTEAAGFNVLGWAVEEDPGPHLYIMPNDRLAKRTVKLRFVPSIKASPSLACMYATGKAQSSMDVLVFSSMDVTIAGSNSATNVRSTPFRRVTIDEFDLCEQSVCEEASQRMGAFENKSTLLVKIGTPSFAETGIDREYLNGDRRRYLCPCPNVGCGAFIEWTFDQMVWSGGLSADPGSVRQRAFIQCPACHGRIENHHKPWCLAWGCWLPDGMHATAPEGCTDFMAWTKTPEALDRHEPGMPHPDLTITGEPDHESVAHHSYRINSLYSPFKTFGWVAEGFISARGNPDRDWWNGKLAIAVKSKGEDVNVETVRRLCVPVEQGGYLAGECPEEAMIVVTGVDIGYDHAWVLSVGFSERMTTGAWIQGVRIEAMRGELPAAGLDFLSRLEFPHKAGGVIRPFFFFIDAQHRPQEVYDLCTSLGAHRAFPIKGMGPQAEAVATKRFQTEQDGRPVRNSLTRMLVNTNHWSEVLWARLFTSAKADQAEKGEILRAASPELMRLPADLPDEHARMFTAEHCVAGVWEKKPGREDNHLLDCWRYAEAGLFKADGRTLTQHTAMTKTGFPRFEWRPSADQRMESPILAAATRKTNRIKAPDLPLKDRFRRP